MYKMLAFVFFITFGLALYGAIKYGFNMVFIYIMLFSLLVTVWSIAAIFTERKGNNNGPKST